MEVSGRRQVDSDEMNTDILCDPCKGQDEEENAVFYCTVCNEYLCNPCTKAHRRAKISKHHHLLDRDSMPKLKLSAEESMCTKHKGKLVEYYCRIHDDCCCSVCATIGHKQCKVEFIDDIAIEFDNSGEYKSLTSVITDLSQQLQTTKITALKNKDEVGHIHSEFVSEVGEFRSEINHTLDSLEQSTLKEAQNVRDNDTKSTESACMNCDAMIADLEEMSSCMEKQETYKQQRQLVICAIKAQSQIKKYGSLNAELNNRYTIREYSFQPNETILQSIKAVNSLGELDDIKKCEGKPEIDNRTDKTSAPTKLVSLRYVGEIDIQHSTDTSEYGCSISGGVMLENNMLALADIKNSNVKVVDIDNNKVILSLKVPSEPWNITRVERDQIVVTCRNKLVFIKVGKTLSLMKEVDIVGKSRGIVYTHNTFIVSFVCPSCVKILDLDGYILKTFKSDKSGKQLFKEPCNIALSTDQNTLYVSDEENHTVTSMDTDGNVQHVYTHDELKGPYSLTVDREDNIYIAGLVSNNIHIISPQCSTKRVLQDGTPGMNLPHAVIYCERDNKLYISHLPTGGFRASNTVSVYQIE